MINGVVAHLGKLGGKSEGALPGVPGLAVADDAELNGVVAAVQLGQYLQQPLLWRTVRLDGDVEGVAPVQADDNGLPRLLLRCTELCPVAGALAAAIGGCLTGNLGAGGDLNLTCGGGEGALGTGAGGAGGALSGGGGMAFDAARSAAAWSSTLCSPAWQKPHGRILLRVLWMSRGPPVSSGRVG